MGIIMGILSLIGILVVVEKLIKAFQGEEEKDIGKTKKVEVKEYDLLCNKLKIKTELMNINLEKKINSLNEKYSDDKNLCKYIRDLSSRIANSINEFNEYHIEDFEYSGAISEDIDKEICNYIEYFNLSLSYISLEVDFYNENGFELYNTPKELNIFLNRGYKCAKEYRKLREKEVFRPKNDKESKEKNIEETKRVEVKEYDLLCDKLKIKTELMNINLKKTINSLNEKYSDDKNLCKYIKDLSSRIANSINEFNEYHIEDFEYYGAISEDTDKEICNYVEYFNLSLSYISLEVDFYNENSFELYNTPKELNIFLNRGYKCTKEYREYREEEVFCNKNNKESKEKEDKIIKDMTTKYGTIYIRIEKTYLNVFNKFLEAEYSDLKHLEEKYEIAYTKIQKIYEDGNKEVKRKAADEHFNYLWITENIEEKLFDLYCKHINDISNVYRNLTGEFEDEEEKSELDTEEVEEEKYDNNLYLMKCSNGTYKIGISVNIERRIKELNNSKWDHELIGYRNDSDDVIKKLERDLHKCFGDKRVHLAQNHAGKTEYFNLSTKEILEVIKISELQLV